MKTKLTFSTDTKDTEQWTDLPFIPRLNEWINVLDLLKKEDLVQIWQSARCWSGIRGSVMSVEYRRADDNDFYIELFVWCED
jgi:hypothetical protein